MAHWPVANSTSDVRWRIQPHMAVCTVEVFDGAASYILPCIGHGGMVQAAVDTAADASADCTDHECSAHKTRVIIKNRENEASVRHLYDPLCQRPRGRRFSPRMNKIQSSPCATARLSRAAAAVP